MNPRENADSNCEECGGEGVCEYAKGLDDSYVDICDKCYPSMISHDLNEDDAYDEWRDSQMENEIKEARN